MTDQVAGFIGADSSGASDAIVTGCSMGAYHALHFALTRADLFPVAICQSGNYDPSAWHAWGDRGDAAYFTNPTDYVPNLHGDHLDWLRGRLHVVLTVGEGPWEVHPTASLPEAHRMAGLLAGPRHLARARRLGPRRGARLAVVAPPDRPPPAPLLLDHLLHRSTPGPRRRLMTDHLIGLLLGAEEDWPRAFEAILRKVGPVKTGGQTHTVSSERLTIEPFGLTDPVRTDLVIDRLAYWYYHPREWLKKAALVNDTYLLNSPFTFQSMEKHSAYCAMVRLGLKVPPTTLVPYKNPVDNVRWAYTSERYNQSFDLDKLADELGYPLYMKPFDGGGWRGVSRVDDRGDLHKAYDESGEMLMHLQATVDYEKFARALSIGPETMVMDFRPDQPMHNRYAVSHDFLSESAGNQAIAISRIVNAFFRWEFNSAEMLVAGDEVYPIDYANACPDVAVTSLHYYFPWAIKALVRWSVYCVVTGRQSNVDLETRRYFEIADDPALDYDAKLEGYLALADEYFETDRYWDWCSENLPHLDEQVHDWIQSDEFDRILRETVAATYPPHEQDEFLAHFRGLLGLWVTDNA